MRNFLRSTSLIALHMFIRLGKRLDGRDYHQNDDKKKKTIDGNASMTKLYQYRYY